MAKRASSKTQEHILDVAGRLFYWNGIRATGVDVIADAAGVAPTSLYRAFRSKDDLVTAYIGDSDRKFREQFEGAAAGESDPRERIMSVFRAMSEETHPDVCRGCSSQMALAEYPDVNSQPHRRAKETKDWLLKRYEELAAEFCTAHAPGSDPAFLASQLFIIHEGVIAGALSGRSDRFTYPGVSLVETLLRSVERPQISEPLE